jgi:hypothetical protein
LEHQVSDVVNAAYQLTKDEIHLKWETTPADAVAASESA